MLVSVITPVTGNPLMKQAIQSVQDQDYPNIEHIIVIDGKEREAAAQALLEEIEFKKPHHVICLPYATGKDGFNGHRIYGMSLFLANGDYLAFLDEDNWFDPNHINSLVQVVEEEHLDWAYALRKIVHPDGTFAIYDNCESLGKWQTCDGNYYQVDANCYFLKKRIAIEYAHLFYTRHGEPSTTNIKNIDLLCDELLKAFPRCDTNGYYTVNYRAEMTKFSTKLEYFQKANAVMQTKYPQGFPWQKDSLAQADNLSISKTAQSNLQTQLAVEISSANFEQNGKAAKFKDSTQAIVNNLALENPYTYFNYREYSLDLQGWGSNDSLFSQIIDQIKPQIIIEVGTWKGASAVHMAKLLQEKHIDGTILCIDTWLGAIEHLSGEYALGLSRKHGYPTLYYQFLANVMYNNLHNSIVPLPVPSNIAARLLQQKGLKADLIYIDASHEADDVYADITQYWQLLKANGVMIGDDYADLNHIGVAAAVNKFVEERNLTLKTARNKWWLQKSSDPQEVIGALNHRISQLELMLMNGGVEFSANS